MAALFLWLSIVSGFIAAGVWFAATVVNHRQERRYLGLLKNRTSEDVADVMFNSAADLPVEREDPEEYAAIATLRNQERMKKIFQMATQGVADQELGKMRILQNRLNGLAALITGFAVLFQTFSTIASALK